MARDYLRVSATNASTERIFSSVANVIIPKILFAHSALISRDYTDANQPTKVMFIVNIVAEEHN
ncbi:hypothetical protein C1645_827605 [Glomus cerebriforme]|uniref:Uncharacterized protein n=1 Tax=Glomus cerebriforme TaxID=658196 RepID=A0A397SXU0_9GLOM|nr:hypothetical protein C1645_827605 [Glomus cerebriforme]